MYSNAVKEVLKDYDELPQWQRDLIEKKDDELCVICGKVSYLGKYCDSCSLDAEKIELRHEGNISKERIISILKDRYTQEKLKP